MSKKSLPLSQQLIGKNQPLKKQKTKLISQINEKDSVDMIKDEELKSNFESEVKERQMLHQNELFDL